MNKNDAGMGLGMAAIMAVCCGGHVLVLALAASGVALATGQTMLIVGSIALTVVALGVLAWRRRPGRCQTGACPPPEVTPTARLHAEEHDSGPGHAEREVIPAGARGRR